MYRYDPAGRRVRLSGVNTFYFAHDGENVVRSSSAFEWRYIHGPGTDDPLVAAYHPNTTWTEKYYYITDGRGRQYAFTNSSGSDYQGALEYTQNGGSHAGGTAASNGFSSERSGSRDAPRLSFYRNRYYDQETGRWTQEDPIGIAGGVNLYQFSGNNPAVFTDPFGLCDPKKDKAKCELVAQLTVGATLGVKEGFKLGSFIGVDLRTGATAEFGTRKTVNLESDQVEDEGVRDVKISAGFKLTFFGYSVSASVGYDSEDPGSLVHGKTNPNEDGTIEVRAQWPVPLGVSATYKVNPAGAYLQTRPAIRNGAP